MQIAQPLLLLLAFGLTHEAFAGEPTFDPRAKLARNVFEKLAAHEAARCLKPGQGDREICSRPPIRIRMEKEKERRKQFAEQIHPMAHVLRDIRAKESAAARAAGHAHVGSSVVVLRNRNAVPASSRPSGPRPIQPSSAKNRHEVRAPHHLRAPSRSSGPRSTQGRRSRL